MHSTTPIEVLRKHWGYASFRPLQEEAIEAAISGKDSLVLLATGGGKSLCYQVPAIILEGMTLVISPLIALMKDQVERLKRQGVRAEALHSGISRMQIERILERALDGQLDLLYLSPERLGNTAFLQRLGYLKVALVAVDEAHCISQWGYDFRPAYLKIQQIRTLLPTVPMMALTATATPRVIEDIRKQLEFRHGHILIQSPYYRSNLSLNVFEEEHKIGKLLNICRNISGSGIVYVRNRRQTQLIAEYLSRRGIEASAYHAGMEQAKRSDIQSGWLSDEYRIIIATNAFGMGIDKPDVRFVVHMDLPDALEAYYQEVGRAGRDGKKGYAILLYNKSDFESLDYQYAIAFPDLDFIRRIYDKLGRFLSVALGAKHEAPVAFDIEAFARFAGEETGKIARVLQLLKQEEWVDFTEAIFQASSLQILVDGREILQLRKQQPKYDKLLAALLRRYEGLYTVRTRISIPNLAKVASISIEETETLLKRLHELGVVDYRKSGQRSEIQFTKNRVAAGHLEIDKKRYRFRAKVAAENHRNMKRYALLDSCRYAFILSYFGTPGSDRCGSCDICLGSKEEYLPAALEREYRQRILELLQTHPAHSFDIVNAFPYNRRNALIRLLETMEEEGLLVYDEMKYTRGRG